VYISSFFFLKKGVKYINGYDDPEIVAGAGTIGTLTS
jgi:threonine dehydratase